ncbi:MAG: RNA polymerase sigma factor [Bacteroidales bacterium]|nr:RNA polymerase sigma factor [Bacteroidales bacterium]MBN2763518.1 RNA polymerase sigma factor [Bacteroidales bacterium]
MEQQILWNRFLKGDKEALELIFRTYFDELYSFGLKMTHNTETVEDSLQDMFFKLWKNRNNLNGISNIKGYLVKALRHHIYDNLNWRNRFVNCETPPENLFDIEFSHEDFLITEQLNQETREKLIHILNKLTNSQREAIYLRFFRGYDFKDISDIMEISVQSVRNAIHRGLLAMREMTP